MRGLFVTATGTGVGKTVLSAALLAAMIDAGEAAVPYKPVITGLLDEREIAARGPWPADDELLGALAGLAPVQVAPERFGAAASPHLAAGLEHRRIDPEQIVERARRLAAADGAPLIVEGVGGLLVPIDDRFTVLDLARALALPTLIAARPGLGTINHTLLTLQVARAGGLDVRAAVLTPWPEAPSALELSNRDTIARLGEVDVHTLATVPGPDVAALAAAGATLPWRSWL
ncbi:MAG TPA: dethiobiotin synthase [Solirubrobacteraceae bacterium]|nr:dethiobiotin synthase [Solirubrobacteraceae bacterium]